MAGFGGSVPGPTAPPPVQLLFGKAAAPESSQKQIKDNFFTLPASNPASASPGGFGGAFPSFAGGFGASAFRPSNPFSLTAQSSKFIPNSPHASDYPVPRSPPLTGKGPFSGNNVRPITKAGTAGLQQVWVKQKPAEGFLGQQSEQGRTDVTGGNVKGRQQRKGSQPDRGRLEQPKGDVADGADEEETRSEAAKQRRMLRFGAEQLANPDTAQQRNMQTSNRERLKAPEKRPLPARAVLPGGTAAAPPFIMQGGQAGGGGGEDENDWQTAEPIHGTCPDMCPEHEREVRERNGSLDPYERLEGDRNRTSAALAVKKYTRTPEREAHLIRPLPVLQTTMGYLLGLLERPYDRDSLLSLHSFLWDRLRAVRMDLRMQHLFSLDAIHMHEQMIRFHILAMHELCEVPKGEGFSEGFDAHLNIEQMNKASVDLFEMYDDHRRAARPVSSELEFRGYYALLKVDKHPGFRVEPSELARELTKMTPEVRSSPEVRFAREVARACRSGNFIKFFRLAKAATYLQACLMHAHFPKLRTAALEVLHAGVAKNQGVPLAALVSWLGMEGEEAEVEELLAHHGVGTKTFPGDEVYMVKEGPLENTDVAPPARCSLLVQSKRAPTVLQDVVTPGKGPEAASLGQLTQERRVQAHHLDNAARGSSRSKKVSAEVAAVPSARRMAAHGEEEMLDYSDLEDGDLKSRKGIPWKGEAQGRSQTQALEADGAGLAFRPRKSSHLGVAERALDAEQLRSELLRQQQEAVLQKGLEVARKLQEEKDLQRRLEVARAAEAEEMERTKLREMVRKERERRREEEERLAQQVAAWEEAERARQLHQEQVRLQVKAREEEQKRRKAEEERRQKEAEERKRQEEEARRAKHREEARQGRARVFARRWQHRARVKAERRQLAEAALAACSVGLSFRSALQLPGDFPDHLLLAPGNHQLAEGGASMRQLENRMAKLAADHAKWSAAMWTPIDIAAEVGPVLTAKNPGDKIVFWKLLLSTGHLDATGAASRQNCLEEDSDVAISDWLRKKLSPPSLTTPGVPPTHLDPTGSAVVASVISKCHPGKGQFDRSKKQRGSDLQLLMRGVRSAESPSSHEILPQTPGSLGTGVHAGLPHGRLEHGHLAGNEDMYVNSRIRSREPSATAPLLWFVALDYQVDTGKVTVGASEAAEGAAGVIFLVRGSTPMADEAKRLHALASSLAESPGGIPLLVLVPLHPDVVEQDIVEPLQGGDRGVTSKNGGSWASGVKKFARNWMAGWRVTGKDSAQLSLDGADEKTTKQAQTRADVARQLRLDSLPSGTIATWHVEFLESYSPQDTAEFRRQGLLAAPLLQSRVRQAKGQQATGASIRGKVLKEECLLEGLMWLAGQSPPQPCLRGVRVLDLVNSHLEPVVTKLLATDEGLVEPRHCVAAFNWAIANASDEVAAAARAYPQHWPPPEARFPPPGSPTDLTMQKVPLPGWNSSEAISALTGALHSLALPPFPRLPGPTQSQNGSLPVPASQPRTAVSLREQAMQLTKMLGGFLQSLSSDSMSELLAAQEAERLLQEHCALVWRDRSRLIVPQWPQIFSNLFQQRLSHLLEEPVLMCHLAVQADPGLQVDGQLLKSSKAAPGYSLWWKKDIWELELILSGGNGLMNRPSTIVPWPRSSLSLQQILENEAEEEVMTPVAALTALRAVARTPGTATVPANGVPAEGVLSFNSPPPRLFPSSDQRSRVQSKKGVQGWTRASAEVPLGSFVRPRTSPSPGGEKRKAPPTSPLLFQTSPGKIRKRQLAQTLTNVEKSGPRGLALLSNVRAARLEGQLAQVVPAQSFGTSLPVTASELEFERILTGVREQVQEQSAILTGSDGVAELASPSRVTNASATRGFKALEHERAASVASRKRNYALAGGPMATVDPMDLDRPQEKRRSASLSPGVRSSRSGQEQFEGLLQQCQQLHSLVESSLRGHLALPRAERRWSWGDAVPC